MHPARERFEVPRAMAEVGREELQGAAVGGIEEDAPGCGKMRGIVLGFLVWEHRAGGGPEVTGPSVEGTTGRINRGVGEIVGFDQFRDEFGFPDRQDRSVVTTGGPAAMEVAKLQGSFKGLVIDARLAELGAQGGRGGEVGGDRGGHGWGGSLGSGSGESGICRRIE